MQLILHVETSLQFTVYSLQWQWTIVGGKLAVENGK